ncbi:MAG: exodeoxyribonuclease VII small subunit [Prevotellaceae bacterium]|jgi:exodeoxyribonuclease VII small subunit|nr:exodeoxyribonuclease VII small subunit [Prevotellaceae bacterium]
MAKNEFNYNKALAELNAILEELENSAEIDMEDISKKMKRAAELTSLCKQQLHEMDKELEKIMEEIK